MIETAPLRLERLHWAAGKIVAGMDEAGRGAWAGPVVAALVILPAAEGIEERLKGVRDSKKMTPLQRSRAAQTIRQAALAWALGQASAEEITRLGILPATRLAFERAAQACSLPAEVFLLDYVPWKNCPLPGERLIRGEGESLSIAAASVLAKTSRDALMTEAEALFPVYGFARHKGYGTAAHATALRENGLCSLHRPTFLRRLQRVTGALP